VAQDEPHVSVGGLLDKRFGYNFEENPKYEINVQQQKKEEKEREECTVREHLGLKYAVKSSLAENKERE
jgi:hypothetical protein